MWLMTDAHLGPVVCCEYLRARDVLSMVHEADDSW
jgi:hypothetical protein